MGREEGRGGREERGRKEGGKRGKGSGSRRRRVEKKLNRELYR